jgi:outer membrane receptor protein involved in Fe transport
MASRVLLSRRTLLAAVAALAVVVAVPTGALARDTFDVTGTVNSKNEDKETIVLITDDLGVKNQPITIDMSDMSSQFVAIRVGQSVSFSIARRESNSYLAYSIVSEGSYVNRADLGTREEFEVNSASIKAHVGNVPEDDESLSQQHRDNNLRRQQDDDHDNCCAPD